MLVSSSSLGEKRDENRQKRERATTTTILHVRKRELNAALWTKKRSLTPPSSCILILSSSSVKRKFSFNELLYDERYEKNLIEKVVGLGRQKKSKAKGCLAKKTRIKQSL